MELMSSQPLMRAIRSDQGGAMEGTQLREFLTRYVAMWHEPDPRRRRAIVQGLFAEDAEDYTTQTAARGLDEIKARVTRAYEEWVAAKSYVFQPTGNTDAHHHLVKFFWQMLPRSGGLSCRWVSTSSSCARTAAFERSTSSSSRRLRRSQKVGGEEVHAISSSW